MAEHGYWRIAIAIPDEDVDAVGLGAPQVVPSERHAVITEELADGSDGATELLVDVTAPSQAEAIQRGVQGLRTRPRCLSSAASRARLHRPAVATVSQRGMGSAVGRGRAAARGREARAGRGPRADRVRVPCRGSCGRGLPGTSGATGWGHRGEAVQGDDERPENPAPDPRRDVRRRAVEIRDARLVARIQGPPAAAQRRCAQRLHSARRRGASIA
jgi:hypothetical protein